MVQRLQRKINIEQFTKIVIFSQPKIVYEKDEDNLLVY